VLPRHTTPIGSDLIIKCALQHNPQGVNLVDGNSIIVCIIESSLALDSEFVSQKRHPQAHSQWAHSRAVAHKFCVPQIIKNFMTRKIHFKQALKTKILTPKTYFDFPNDYTCYGPEHALMDMHLRVRISASQMWIVHALRKHLKVVMFLGRYRQQTLL